MCLFNNRSTVPLLDEWASLTENISQGQSVKFTFVSLLWCFFLYIYFVFVKQNINEFRALYLSVQQRQLLLLTLVGQLSINTSIHST